MFALSNNIEVYYLFILNFFQIFEIRLITSFQLSLNNIIYYIIFQIC